MTIDPLGELAPDEHIPEWLVSPEVEVPLLGGARLRFVLEEVEDDPAPDEFGAAVRSFLALAPRDRDEATPYVYRNYRRFLEDVDEDDEYDLHVGEPAEIWEYVYPSVIHVSRRLHGDHKVYVSIEAECEWEVEHGLQIVYREGKTLSRVSEQDGHLTHADAYALPESEDRIA